MLVNNTLEVKKRVMSPLRFIFTLMMFILLAPVQAAEVTLTLTDGATNQVAPDTEIYVYRITDDGALQYVVRQNTDANGQLLVELENIENGTQYQFKTRAFNSSNIYSDVISNVTEHNFVVGSKILHLKNGADAANPALANYRVDVKYPNEEGKLQWVTRAESDDNGIVRFNLQSDKQYVFASRSTLTNEEKRSPLSAASGQQDFVVGNQALTISLINGVTGVPLAEQRIDVKRIEADGSKSWAGRRTTDVSGVAVFDLEGLGQGTVYELYSRDASGFFARTNVSQVGPQSFPLGNARVAILNGRVASQEPHIGKSVTIYEQVGDSREWVLKVNSDANGHVLLDLPGLESQESGRQYIARIRHESKNYEAPITTTGDSNAVFGRLPQNISATVFNTATNAPVVGERVDLLRWDGDKKRHAGRMDTDANGRVEFDAQGLYDNEVFVLRINPFDGNSIESDNIAAASDINFNVHLQESGFQVQVIDGTAEQTTAIPNQRVTVFRVDGENRHYYTRRNTDESGTVAFTLPGFDQGQQYVLETRHTQNNKNIRSAPFSGNGNHVFTVGNTPLTISLVNPVTNSAIEGARIDVMRTREDGNTWREGRQTSNESGEAVFHLTDITDTSPAQIKVWSEEGFYAQQQITRTGQNQIALGNTQVTLRNGRADGDPVLADTRVRIYKYSGEDRSRVFDRNSSENGVALMQLDELQGEEYFEAEVTLEGDKYKSTFGNIGDVQLVFGNNEEDILISLLDGTGEQPTPMAEKRIAVYRIEGDKLAWVSNKNTDANGLAKLALRGLSDGQQFVLKAQHPISGKWFESETVTSNSAMEFVVGIQPMIVTLVNPVTQQSIANARIDVKRQREDGSWYGEARATTDENGQVTFHLTEVSDNKPAKLEARSEDSFYDSKLVTVTGEQPFPLGNTQVTLRNGRADGNPVLADTRVRIYKYSGEDRSRVFDRDTSANGIALMALDELQESEYYQAEVSIEGDRYKEQFTSLGDVQLTFGNAEEDILVTLLDGTGAEPVLMAEQTISVNRFDGERFRGISNKSTDANGTAKLSLPGLSEGDTFLLKAKHPLSGKWFESQIIDNQINNNTLEFVVGIPPMVVTLVNPVTNNPVVNATVDAMRTREDGSLHRQARQKTDDNGQVTFHLTTINTAMPVLLKAWTSEGFYTEKSLETTGAHDLPLGNTQITVRNGRVDGNPLLTDTRLRVYKHSGENRERAFDRNTSTQGIALMDLDTLAEGEFFRAEVTVEGDKFSHDFSATGAVELVFGDVSEDTLVTVIDGTQAQSTALTDWRIAVYQVNIDQKLQWFTNKNTDENGTAKLPLTGINEGQQYRLKAKHAVTGKWFESDIISNSNDFTFVVGAPALIVNLTHPGTGAALPGARIDAIRFRDDESVYRQDRQTTDDNGQATFYLTAISDTAPVELRMRSAEGFGASTQLTATGTQTVPFGNVAVQVINTEDNQLIIGKRLDAYWMDANNELNWETRGNTNSNGEVLLDLDRLAQGTRYALKVHNPFGENKRYYGPIVYNEGAIQFLIAKGEQTELDLEDPDVFIASPTRDKVNGLGFLLGGVASDNNSISRVEVSVSDPIKGISTGEAILLGSGSVGSGSVGSGANGQAQWQFSVNQSAISLNETITITATAYDLALNSAQFSKTFEVVEDMEAPVISIVSHEDNDNVNETGFTVIGQASDDTGVVTVTATLSDPLLGTTIEAQTVSVAEDGQWALIVTNGKVSGGQTASLNLTATDSSDKTTDLDINLVVQTIVPQQQQLISRITFGMTPNLYINQPDAITFMAEQLAPATVDDTELEAQIAAMDISELGDLRAMQLHYMLYSNRQLNEVMTWFWDNHFNTNFNVHRNVAFELAENQGFRQHALGSFRDLLGVSAKSPAMIYYLNNAENVVGRANENYSREVMELSTMGVDGGYTAQDIAELARIFTGWHEQDGAFFFNEEQHDFGSKQFLGETIQGDGLAEGERALDLLASHPSTARNICRKLITLFVSDVPVTTLQGQCEGQFLASGGNIASVVQIILTSSEFVSLQHQGNKIKTPVEMVLAAIRSVNATPNYPELNETLDRLAYGLFTYPVPTGLAETGAGYISSNALLERIRFANKFALEGESGASVDLMSLLMVLGYSSSDAIVGVLADLTLNGRLTDLERDIATDLLNENIPEGESFSMQSPDAEEKLQRLLGTMLSYPAFQYQ